MKVLYLVDSSMAKIFWSKTIMKYIDHEYFYNWNTTKANIGNDEACASAAYDAASLGTICPTSWTLPAYVTSDITPANLWSDGNNYGMLITSGYMYGASHINSGSYGEWWSSSRSSAGNDWASALLLYQNNISRSNYGVKSNGFSIRCMRSN